MRFIILLLLVNLFIIDARALVPKRIVSINLCTDILLLLLADKKNIVAITSFAHNDFVSPVTELAHGVPIISGKAEDIIALHPDLVLANIYNSPFTIKLLHKAGINVVMIHNANNFNDIKKNISIIARATGTIKKGKQLINNFTRKLGNRINDNLKARVYKVFFNPLLLKVLQYKGFKLLSIASLEEMVGADLIILPPRYNKSSMKNMIIKHPFISSYIRQSGSKVITLPYKFWVCGSPFVTRLTKRLTRVYNQIK